MISVTSLLNEEVKFVENVSVFVVTMIYSLLNVVCCQYLCPGGQ